MVMKYIKSIAKWSAVILVIGFALIQLAPVDRANPAVETEVPASAEARVVLRRGCYDCHSNETVWPWYSRIAPVSWLTARDVREGRKALSFSTWNRLNTKEQIKALRKQMARELGDKSESPRGKTDESPPGGEALINLIIEHTHTCYLGDRVHRHAWGYGCGTCPACELRERGYARFRAAQAVPPMQPLVLTPPLTP